MIVWNIYHIFFIFIIYYYILQKVGENGEGDRRDSVTRSLEARQSQWKRIMLLVVAITVHNIPEGLAVGVSFGAAGSSDEASFHTARWVTNFYDVIQKTRRQKQKVYYDFIMY